MPTISENKGIWDGAYGWSNSGDEWSKNWGSPSMQWYGTLLPRIHSFIPVDTILEIAPGYGRWTQYLKLYCKRLIVVDVSEKCIKACKERFKSDSNIEYHINDGTSLEMISDGTIGFVFSFDSLVHVDELVIDQYMKQLSHKLTPEGAGFIHHSNLNEYKKYFSIVKNLRDMTKKVMRIPDGDWGGVVFEGKAQNKISRISVSEIIRVLGEIILFDSDNRRDISMSAKVFERISKKYGMNCISQELVNWGHTRRLIDSMSVFVRKDGHERQNKILRNKCFMKEARQIRRYSSIYPR